MPPISRICSIKYYITVPDPGDRIKYIAVVSCVIAVVVIGVIVVYPVVWRLTCSRNGMYMFI